MRPLVFDSTELRWFESGAIPFDPATFDPGHGAPAAILDQRPDVYCLSADDGLGVKLRGDADSPKLEVKVRTAGEPFALGNARGLLERWRKWSWSGPEWEPSGAAALEDEAGRGAGDHPAAGALVGPWVTIEKRRGLWRFEWRDGAIRFLTDARIVERGGAIEVTALEVAGRAAWSYGVEAFGHGAESGRIVRAAALILLEATDRGAAAEDDSCGYPRWLKTISQPGTP